MTIDLHEDEQSAPRPEDRMELLCQLRVRRRELVDAYAVGLALGDRIHRHSREESRQ